MSKLKRLSALLDSLPANGNIALEKEWLARLDQELRAGIKINSVGRLNGDRFATLLETALDKDASLELRLELVNRGAIPREQQQKIVENERARWRYAFAERKWERHIDHTEIAHNTDLQAVINDYIDHPRTKSLNNLVEYLNQDRRFISTSIIASISEDGNSLILTDGKKKVELFGKEQVVELRRKIESNQALHRHVTERTAEVVDYLKRCEQVASLAGQRPNMYRAMINRIALVEANGDLEKRMALRNDIARRINEVMPENRLNALEAVMDNANRQGITETKYGLPSYTGRPVQDLANHKERWSPELGQTYVVNKGYKIKMSSFIDDRGVKRQRFDIGSETTQTARDKTFTLDRIGETADKLQYVMYDSKEGRREFIYYKETNVLNERRSYYDLDMSPAPTRTHNFREVDTEIEVRDPAIIAAVKMDQAAMYNTEKSVNAVNKNIIREEPNSNRQYGQQSKEAERPQKMPIHSQPQGNSTQFTIQNMQIEEIMRERQSLQEAIQRQRRALKHVRTENKQSNLVFKGFLVDSIHKLDHTLSKIEQSVRNFTAIAQRLETGQFSKDSDTAQKRIEQKKQADASKQNQYQQRVSESTQKRNDGYSR
jgi:hypothetical protein